MLYIHTCDARFDEKKIPQITSTTAEEREPPRYLPFTRLLLLYLCTKPVSSQEKKMLTFISFQSIFAVCD